MGQLLIIKDADFSNNPNAVNIDELPAIEDQLFGLYTGRTSDTDADDVSMLNLPSEFGERSEFSLINPSSTLPRYISSSYFKGKAISFSDGSGVASTGFKQKMMLNFEEGTSITALVRRVEPAVGITNRVLFSFQELEFQFKIITLDNEFKFLQIGLASDPNVKYYSFPNVIPDEIQTYALTVIIKNNQIKLFQNNILRDTVDISSANIPTFIEDVVTFGSNWNGGSGLRTCQVKSFQIHNKALTDSEVYQVHSALLNLIL